jgi:hypothetical protein
MDYLFIETSVFTRRLAELGLEADLKMLQEMLLRNPEAGDLDPGTGGLRKVRMRAGSRGKGTRGGARVHYLHLPHVRRIYLLYVYGKGDQDSLTATQKRQLKSIVQAIREQLRPATLAGAITTGTYRGER